MLLHDPRSIIIPHRQIILPPKFPRVPRRASFLPPGNVQHRRKNYLLGGGSSGTPDPLFGNVVYLTQGADFIDYSNYGRSIGQQTANAVSQVAFPAFPSGFAYSFTGGFQHNQKGLVLGNGPELNMASQPLTMEGFFYSADYSGGAQILYNTAFGFNDFLLFYSQISGPGRLFARVNSLTDVGSDPGVTPNLVAGVATYWCVQFNIDASVTMWTGAVASGVANGGLSLSAEPRPVVAVAAGPYQGYVGGSGGINNYLSDQMRFTFGVERYDKNSATLAIPTEQFPTF